MPAEDVNFDSEELAGCLRGCGIFLLAVAAVIVGFAVFGWLGLGTALGAVGTLLLLRHRRGK